jgi:hypothetical protein
MLRCVVFIAVVAVALLVWGDGDGSRSPTTTEPVAPVLSAGDSTNEKATDPDLETGWTETFFPGPGSLTGVASSIHRMAVLWGQIGSHGVIYDVHADDGSRWATRTLPDTSLQRVSDSRYGRHILAESASGPVRITIGHRGDQAVTALPSLPARVVEHAEILIGFDHTRPIGSLTFSENGMEGGFLRSVPGPRGYAVVSEEGRPVLYRWIGGTR